MIKEPHRNAIAVCSLGLVGRITVDRPIMVHYDGKSEMAWIGQQLQDRHCLDHNGTEKIVTTSMPWVSREPVVLVDANGEIDFNADFRKPRLGSGASA